MAEMAHYHSRNNRGSRHDCLACNSNPFMLGTMTETIIDELYIALSVLEQREIDFAMLDRAEHRNAVRLAMLPIKREINKLEGREIYPEASH